MRKIIPLNLIMLVDDDDTTNYLNHRLLTQMNAARHIKVVKDGEKAFEYLTHACDKANHATHPCPDLIFMDIKMPVMDGFEFLEMYEQADLALKNKVTILMLTSSASFYDLERLKKYEAVKKHYSKALTEADVKEILTEYFPNHITVAEN
ncbi:response regulator [Adhaeribacter arboris]|uniref:Response regulator n=1 Tax=Adhaeribacter arboris TaxID=2072846 RepID=A0A2T2YHG9_9BACT|nr:response regulator [Adhaeribacter arboris]PSR54918.1 response regulator [Adhaeribacter arboris]